LTQFASRGGIGTINMQYARPDLTQVRASQQRGGHNPLPDFLNALNHGYLVQQRAQTVISIQKLRQLSGTGSKLSH
jgi:hypothetical protein